MMPSPSYSPFTPSLEKEDHKVYEKVDSLGNFEGGVNPLQLEKTNFPNKGR